MRHRNSHMTNQELLNIYYKHPVVFSYALNIRKHICIGKSASVWSQSGEISLMSCFWPLLLKQLHKKGEHAPCLFSLNPGPMKHL